MSIFSTNNDVDPVARYGTVVSAPAALEDSFEVVVPDFDTTHIYEIRRWQPRGLTLPAEGDEVLVIVDDVAEPWVPAWWPAKGDVALAREHPFDYGIVTALPTKEPTPQAGDRCTFKSRIGELFPYTYWDLVYTGEATYPWAKVGGAPMEAAGVAIERTGGAMDGTSCPTWAVPLAMQVRASLTDTWARLTNSPVGVDGTVRSIYIAGVQTTVEQVNDSAALFGGGKGGGPWPGPYTIAKGGLVGCAFTGGVNGNKFSFSNILLTVDPLRVG